MLSCVEHVKNVAINSLSHCGFLSSADDISFANTKVDSNPTYFFDILMAFSFEKELNFEKQSADGKIS